MENKQDNNQPLIEGLQPFLQDAWTNSGFQSLTPIQEKAIPAILEGKDVVCESPTGTGKTLAYLLPILEKLDPTRPALQAVILAPSQELVMQILEQFQIWSKGSGIIGTSLIGGANIKKQIEKLKKKPQLVIGTPGRIFELIKMKKLKMHEVKTIVVDEFDVMITPEHLGDIKSIMKTTLKDRQTVFFSATLSDQTNEVAGELMRDPEYIRINEKEMEAIGSNVEHLYLLTELRDKIDVLRSLLHTGDMKALVFINKIERLGEVEEKLRFKGIKLAALAGESHKKERKEAIDNFRSGKVSVLLTTELAARGLDIQGITHVIHFDFPQTTKQYVHRSGRTGRMGAEGTVISIVTKREESYLQQVGKELGLSVIQVKLFKGKLQ